MFHKPMVTLATRIIAALGAYCPRVKFSANEDAFIAAQLKGKRRTRPLTGRGNYGKNLMAHFDMKGIVWSSKKSKQKH